MIIPPDPQRERASTYIVENLSGEEEVQRLQLQNTLITGTLGGMLPEQPEPARFKHILDVACGTGGWLIELAKTYRAIPQLMGIDISKRMITLASAQAEVQQVQDRVLFRIMDALHLSELSDNLFDLTNLRFAASFLRSWEWQQVLYEMQRVTHPGGVVRVTESDLPDESTSQALLSLFELLARAYNQAGKYFKTQANGVSNALKSLLEQQELRDVQTQVYRPEIRAGTVNGQLFFEDMKYLFRTNIPFLRKWTKVPDNYEELYERMLYDMQQPDFFVANQTITVWGSKAKS
jgi:ubiquinone/menaquinone biosynthesis C-methylase UbiE